MFGMGSKSIVGLDVGSSSIKAVELKKKGGQIEVAHLGLEPLSSDIVVDSMIVDSGTVSSAISKLFLDNAINLRRFLVADVQDVEHALARKEHEPVQHLVLLWLEFQFPQRPLAFERLTATRKQSQLGFEQRFFPFLQIF